MLGWRGGELLLHLLHRLQHGRLVTPPPPLADVAPPHARSCTLGAVRVPPLALIAARLLRFTKSLRSGRWIASRPSPGGLQHDSVGVKIHVHVHVHVAVHLSSLMILLGQKRWHRPPRFGNHQAKFTRDRSGGIYSYQMCRTLPLAQGVVLHRAVPPSDAWASVQERITRGPL